MPAGSRVGLDVDVLVHRHPPPRVAPGAGDRLAGRQRSGPRRVGRDPCRERTRRLLTSNQVEQVSEPLGIRHLAVGLGDPDQLRATQALGELVKHCGDVRQTAPSITAWTARQIVVVREGVRSCVSASVGSIRICEALTAPHSPWQNPFAERLIGSVRRECLDHVLVLSERHLRRVLTSYFAYYHGARTHLSLEKDAPDARPIERPAMGKVVPIPEVGGLHHRYVRRAA